MTIRNQNNKKHPFNLFSKKGMKKVLMSTMAVAMLTGGFIHGNEQSITAEAKSGVQLLPQHTGVNTKLTMGGNSSSFIDSNGELYTWGSNSVGQLGHGDNVNRFLPTKVEGLSNVVAVSLSRSHSTAISTDGSLYSWGLNSKGELGHGDEENRNTPTKVEGLSNVVAISLGRTHSSAITADGDLYTWGWNYQGQLGHGDRGNNTDRNVPTKVEGLSNVVAVSLGGLHSSAITADGSLYTWGSNNVGQLGHGDNVDRNVPTKVESLSDVEAVSIWYSSSALTKDGKMYTWGENRYGLLGHGHYTGKSVPTLVEGLDNVVSLSLGEWHSSAIANDGKVYLWGWGRDGQLGNGSGSTKIVPIHIEGITFDNTETVALSAPIATIIKNVVSLSIVDGNEFTIEYRLNGGSWQVYHAPFEINELTLIEARASDKAGNVSAISSYVLSPQSDEQQEEYVSFALNWFSIEGAVAYKILKNGEEIGQVDAPITRFVDENVKVGDLNSYEIIPVFADASEGDGQVPDVEVTDPLENPDADFSFVDEFIYVEWQAIDGADYYEVYKNGELVHSVIDDGSLYYAYEELYDGEDAFFEVFPMRYGETASSNFDVVDLNEKVDNAKDAVENAKSNPTEENINTAFEIVSKIPNGSTVKFELVDLLNGLQEQVDEEKQLFDQATNAVNEAENNPSDENVNNAQEAINRLPDGTVKDDLQNRLDEVKNELENSKLIEVATQAVTTAENNPSQENVDIAQEAINMLPVSTVKDELQNRLDGVKNQLDEVKLVEEATNAVEKAEKNSTQENVDHAYEMVSKLPDSAMKVELLDRLDAVQEEIDNENGDSEEGWSEVALDTWKTIQLANKYDGFSSMGRIAQKKFALVPHDDFHYEFLKEQIELMNKNLQDYFSQFDKNTAEKRAEDRVISYENGVKAYRTLALNGVNALPDSEFKEYLLHRMELADEAYLLEAEKAQIEKAEEALSKAKATKSAYNISSAEREINKLSEGAVKDRLMREFLEFQNELNGEKLLNDAMTAMDRAETSKTNSNVERADEAISKLIDSEAKTALLERLNALKLELGLDDESLYQKALEAIETAKKYSGSSFYHNRALQAIEKVNDEEKKQVLLDMLNE